MAMHPHHRMSSDVRHTHDHVLYDDGKRTGQQETLYSQKRKIVR